MLDAANGHSEHHDPCRRFIDGLRVGTTSAFLVWGVCYEFLRVSTHANVFPSPLSWREAVGFIDELLALPRFGVLTETDRHTAVLARTLAEFPDIRGSRMHDLHTVVLMREHGVSEICTRDAGFRRFPFLTIVDPLGAADEESP